MQSLNYTNIAFISYKREDEKWAKWLQNKLEHYQLPIEIRKQKVEFAERPRHVFKDTTDLSGGVLEKAIKEGLASSKFLIVICSPRAAKSIWVCKEVQEFIDSGREEFIIPFIIDGEPYSKDIDKECFPDALKSLAGKKELLGININENGRDSAAVKAIARMFDVRFDTLWQRFQREQKKRRKYTIGALIGAIVFLIGIGAWIGLLYHNQSITNKELNRTNNELDNRNNELKTKNIQIEQQNKDLDAQRDSIANVNLALLTANENITKQKNELQKANDDLMRTERSLAQSNTDLSKRNHQLREEKEHVQRINWELLGSQSQAISDKASLMMKEGRYAEAAAWVCSALPNEHLGSRPLIGNASSILYNAHVSFVSKSLSCLIGHADEVSFISFSNDNKYAVTASYDGTAKVWQAEKLIATINVGSYPLNSAVFNRDATKILLATNGNGAQIWDLKTCKLTKHFHKGKWVQSAVFNEDEESVLLCDFDSKATIWDVLSEEKTKILSGHSGGVLTASYSPDGKYIVTGSQDKTAKIWNSNTGKLMYTFNNHSSFVNSAQYSKDGKFILTATDQCVKLWDSKNKKEIRTIKGNKISSASFCDDGQFIITSSLEGTAKIWSVKDGKELFTLKGHTRGLNYATFDHSNSLIATASKDYTVRLWEIPRDEPLTKYDDTYIYASHDKQYVVTHNYLNSSHIADIRDNNGNKLFSIVGETNILNAVFSNDNKYVAILSTDSITKIGIIPTSSEIELKGHSNRVSSASFSPDNNNIATASWDNSAIIWDLKTIKRKYKLEGHTKRVNSIAYSNDGNFVVTASADNTAIIWSTKTGKPNVVLKGHVNSVNYASFSFDGKYVVTCSADLSVRIWDSKSGNIIKIYKGHTDNVNSAVFSKDSNYIISASNDGTVKVWYLPYNTCIYSIGEKMAGYNELYKFANLSQDGNSIIAHSVGEPIIWPFISIKELIKRYSAVFEKYPYDYLHRDVPWAPWDLNVVR